MLSHAILTRHYDFYKRRSYFYRILNVVTYVVTFTQRSLLKVFLNNFYDMKLFMKNNEAYDNIGFLH